MLLTFTAAINKLAAARAFAAESDVTEQKGLLNEALEKIILSGRWNGTQDNLNLVLHDNKMTLPRNYVTALGVKVNGYVRDLGSVWFSFMQGTSDPVNWSFNILDQGDGFCVFKQPREPAKLRIASTGFTGTAEVHGFDVNNAEVWNGAQRGDVMSFNASKTPPYFTTVTALIKPVTLNLAQLYACYDDSTEEVIGIYEPGETVPSYRQYIVPEATGAATVPGVIARCQRRHIDLVADNDICPIDNFGALKRAIASIHWDNEGDEKRSEKHFDNAIQMLNDELKRLHPTSEVGAMRVNAKYCVAHGLYSFR